jgi:hypothetical protein
MLGACDPEAPLRRDGDLPEGADAGWFGRVGHRLGLDLVGSSSELSMGTEMDSCGDSGGCEYFGETSWVYSLKDSPILGVSGKVVARITASQVTFVDDCDGDGGADLLAGNRREAKGAVLLSGKNGKELASFEATKRRDVWVNAIGSGNSLPVGTAVVLLDQMLYRDGGGIYFYESTRRGSLGLDEADASYRSEEVFAYYSAGVGDLDGDGLDDLAVSAEFPTGGCMGISTSLAPFEGVRAPQDEGVCVSFVGAGPVVPLVDMNMDGHLDLLVEGGFVRDVVLFWGPITENRARANADMTVAEGGGEGDFCEIGDFDGDGRPDLAVGQPYTDANGDRWGPGQVYLFFAPEGVLELEDADLRFSGRGTEGDFGNTLAGVGDINDDGRDELAVGAPGEGEGGAVYLFLGE